MIVYAVYCSFYQEPDIECIFLNEKKANKYTEEENIKWGDFGRKTTAWFVREFDVIE